MNGAIQDNRQKSPQERWASFLRNNEKCIVKIRETNHRLDHDRFVKKNELSNRGDFLNLWTNSYLDSLMTGVFSSLSNQADAELPLGKDIEAVRKLSGSILDAQKEEILNEEEALALLSFITAKFVERKTNRIMKHMLPTGEHRQWFYKSHKVLCEND